MSSHNCAVLPEVGQPERRQARDMRVLFVAEQFVPPVYDGSTAVYEAWLQCLRKVADVYGIFFTWRGMPTDQTHAFLRNTCRDYLILPGHAESAVMKMLRTLGRLYNGSLFPPTFIEEFGRWPIQRDIARFIARHQPDVAFVSKLECVYLIGHDLLSGLRIPKLLDLHDDFVQREKLSRQVVREVIAAFPALAMHPMIRNFTLRRRMSRLDLEAARRQERQLLDLFDRILISSQEEYAAYSARAGLAERCVHMPWPIQVTARPVKRKGPAEYDAGVIGSYNPFNVQGLHFFIDQVLPLIRRRRPGFRLLVAGNIDEAFRLTGLSAEGVEVAGPVEELSSFYDRVNVCIVPVLNGTGVSLKTLEALHRGLPVVATSAGARGLVREELPNLCVADTPAAMAEVILSLLEGLEASAPAVPGGTNGAAADSGRRFLQICREAGVQV